QDLVKSKFSIKKLNLFGNIPILKNRNYSQTKEKNTINFFLFGNIRKCDDLPGFIAWLKEAQNKSSSLIKIHFVGKNGSNIMEWKNYLEKSEISYTVHGFQ